MVLPVRIELTTSPLPRGCSTTELRQRPPRRAHTGTATRARGNCHRGWDGARIAAFGWRVSLKIGAAPSPLPPAGEVVRSLPSASSGGRIGRVGERWPHLRTLPFVVRPLTPTLSRKGRGGDAPASRHKSMNLPNCRVKFTPTHCRLPPCLKRSGAAIRDHDRADSPFPARAAQGGAGTASCGGAQIEPAPAQAPGAFAYGPARRSRRCSR
jgi:hypothetical protein